MLNLDEFKNMLDKLSEQHNVPAIQVGIIKDGEVIFKGGTGYRDFDKKIEADPDTVFAIGSASKAFTGAAAAILVDEGKIEWDKPIKYYIPELEMYDSYVTENVTVRDALCHRTGLSRHDLMWYLGVEGTSFKDLMPRLKYLKPSVPFRGKMQYQNHIFGLIGYLIERVTGKTWAEFVHERILVPLGMNNTNFTVEDTKKLENKALPYQLEDGKIKEMPFLSIDICAAAGAINSSINDMLKWVKFNLDKGKVGDKTIISEKNIEECHTPQMIVGNSMYPWKFSEIDFMSYGFGWFIESYRGHKVIHHGGTVDGFISLVSFIPELNAGFVILTNGDRNWTPSVIQYWLYDKLFGLDEIDWNERYTSEYVKMLNQTKEQIEALKNSVPQNTKLSLELKDYCGEYNHDGYGKVLITEKDGNLVAKWGRLESTLEHLCFDSFLLPLGVLSLSVPVKFNVDFMGKVTSVDIDFESSINEMIRFVKIS